MSRSTSEHAWRRVVAEAVTRRTGASCRVRRVLLGAGPVLLVVACSPAGVSELTASWADAGPGEARGVEVESGGGAGLATAPAPVPRSDGRATRPGGDPGRVSATAASGLPRVLDRALLQEVVTRQEPCDGGVLVLAAGDAVEVTGRCAALTVTGAGARVLAGDVERLVVHADGAQVVVGAVDEVDIAGSGTRVAWEDGIPRVASAGTDVGHGAVGVVRLDAAG